MGVYEPLNVLPLSRAIYLSNLWKQSAQVHSPDISEFGWHPDGAIAWVEQCFPAEVESIMDELEKSEDTDDDLVLISHESDVDSDQEC